MVLRPEFLAEYEDRHVPFGGNGLGEFVYQRTYARWLPDKQRRERWHETCARVVNYSMSLDTVSSDEDKQREAEALFDAMFNMRVFPAGRTLWIGGTPITERSGTANFNCAFVVIDSFEAVGDLFHLLLVGAGVGFRILPGDVGKLPLINSDIVIAHKPYNPKAPNERRQDTVVFVESSGDKSSAHIVVGDSKEGWVQALRTYFELIQRYDIESIILNYDSVRPHGEILKTFGGRASGHNALRDMFRALHGVVRRTTTLQPIDVLDMCNHIGGAVVVGGVRRTAQIALFDPDDNTTLTAKVGIFEPNHPNHGNTQRTLSNNSIIFNSKPSAETLRDIFTSISASYEPGFVNAEAAQKRRPNFQGLNPCAEILLDSRGVCNLTEINIAACVTKDKTGKTVVDWLTLLEAIHLATCVGVRQTNVTIDLPEWDMIQKRDRLIGVSIDGWMDFVEATQLQPFEQDELLIKLQNAVKSTAHAYAFDLRIPAPLLCTTIKPSGSISQLPSISSGIHRACSEYYVRRVRITASDPLARAALDYGYPVYPDLPSIQAVGDYKHLPAMQRWDILRESPTWVVEFPVKSSTSINAGDESAIDQLTRYLQFQKLYTDHNTSITIYYNEDEVNDLINALLKHWDQYVGVSFMPRNYGVYPLMPEEPITQQEYDRCVADLQENANEHGKTLIQLLQALESQYEETELDSDCATGACPVR